jgi:hypothetical protein
VFRDLNEQANGALLIDDGFTPIRQQTTDKRLLNFNYVSVSMAKNVILFIVTFGDPTWQPS